VKDPYPIVDLSSLSPIDSSYAHLRAVRLVQLIGGGAVEFWCPLLDGVKTRIIDDILPLQPAGRFYDLYHRDSYPVDQPVEPWP
jgi:hypothetical protein